jgi:hypothetical protein
MRPLTALTLSLLLPSSATADEHTTGIRCGNNTSPVGSTSNWGQYGIIFKSSLSYGFLRNNSQSVTQVCLLSGPMVGHALGIEEKGLAALRILPIHTHGADKLGYVAAAVVVNAPNGDVEKKLNAAIQAPNSTLYQHPEQLIRSLAQQIDVTEGVIVGEFWHYLSSGIGHPNTMLLTGVCM